MLVTFAVRPATAQDSARTDQTSVKLLSAVTATGDLARIPLGIGMTLKAGWKTYWRSPGDAGFAPSIDIAGSQNVAVADLAFPVPHRFELFGLQTFGYGDEIVFPLNITPKNPGQPIRLRAHLRYLVCEQICIPYEHDLALDLSAGPAGVSNDAALISRYQALVPDDGAKARFALSDLHVTDRALKLKLYSAGAALEHPDIIVEGPNGLYFNKPRVELTDNGQAAEFTVPVDRDPNAPDVANSELILTVFDGQRALEQHVVPGRFAGPLPIAMPAERAPGLGPMLLIALLGGLILNVMPCVLPVLVLKLSNVLEHAGAGRRAVRWGFLASAGGILCAFIVLSLILVAIKASGQSIGWGIQFQQPVFLGALAALCLAFAANIWGWFQIPVPAFAGMLTEVAERSEARRPLLGAFLGGVLATILATPCSAPFVGSAVGFALARGPAEITAIFLALGIGLALPYLAIAAAPQLVTWLPRPGRWMLWLKKLLGLSLAATGLWLIFVLIQQAGYVALPQRSGDIDWHEFDAAAIPTLVGEGKVVFVDVTAEWCLTCKANKEFVLTRAPVVDALDDTHAMRADWTRPDPAISAYLSSFGRFGIPMNVVYGPGAPAGILLPELLSSDDVMTALKQAE
jgi:suppressor for copper-sensitivity B